MPLLSLQQSKPDMAAKGQSFKIEGRPYFPSPENSMAPHLRTEVKKVLKRPTDPLSFVPHTAIFLTSSLVILRRHSRNTVLPFSSHAGDALPQGFLSLAVLCALEASTQTATCISPLPPLGFCSNVKSQLSLLHSTYWIIHSVFLLINLIYH